MKVEKCAGWWWCDDDWRYAVRECEWVSVFASSHRNFLQRHHLFPPSHNTYTHLINLIALAFKIAFACESGGNNRCDECIEGNKLTQNVGCAPTHKFQPASKCGSQMSICRFVQCVPCGLHCVCFLWATSKYNNLQICSYNQIIVYFSAFVSYNGSN